MRRYARFLSRETNQADDLVQECPARAIARIDSWQPGTNLTAWLTVILRNIFFNECRRRKRERETLKDPQLTETNHFSAHQDAGLMLAELEQAFFSLSIDHREILTLVVMEGLTYDQAAELLGISTGTVKSRLARARTRLNDIMGGERAPQKDRRTGGGALRTRSRTISMDGSQDGTGRSSRQR